MTTETRHPGLVRRAALRRHRRLHTARDVADQRGTIPATYAVARDAAIGFHDAPATSASPRAARSRRSGRTRRARRSTQRRHGIEAVYLGGWATSRQGLAPRGPGPGPRQLPAERGPGGGRGHRPGPARRRSRPGLRASALDERREQAATPAIDYCPFVIADADTGHGGDAHVRNVIRRFVEVGVPGYHLEDQRPGAKKCGHQAGKVLVSPRSSSGGSTRRASSSTSWASRGSSSRAPTPRRRRSSTTRPTSATARSCWARRTSTCPRYRVVSIVVQERLHELGLTDVRGHQLYELAPADRDQALIWLAETGLDLELAVAVGTERRAAAAAGRPLDGPAVLDAVGGPGRRRAGPTRLASRPGRRPATDRGTPSCRARPTASIASAAVSSRPSRGRSRPPRSPTCCGWRPRRPTSRTPVASRTRSTPSTRGRCSPTTCRPRSTGTPRAWTTRPCGASPTSSGGWASCSPSSPTAGTRSTVWPPRSSRPPCVATGCSRWPGCSVGSACSTRRTGCRRRSSVARAATPR